MRAPSEDVRAHAADGGRGAGGCGGRLKGGGGGVQSHRLRLRGAVKEGRRFLAGATTDVGGGATADVGGGQPLRTTVYPGG